MTRHLLCAAVLLVGTTALQAASFTFSYAGEGGVSASGTLNATLLSSGSGVYSVDNMTGIRTTSTKTSTISGGSGLFCYNSTPLLNAGGIAFNLSGLFGLDSVAYVGGAYQESMAGIIGFTAIASTTPLKNFSISAVGVPEPSVPALLLTMGLGVLVLARKLPYKRT